jgi:hypothetical protein
MNDNSKKRWNVPSFKNYPQLILFTLTFFTILAIGLVNENLLGYYLGTIVALSLDPFVFVPAFFVGLITPYNRLIKILVITTPLVTTLVSLLVMDWSGRFNIEATIIRGVGFFLEVHLVNSIYLLIKNKIRSK